MPGDDARAAAPARDDLAIAGTLAAILAVGALGSALEREAYEWLQYTLVGVALPLAVLALARGRRGGSAARVLAVVGAAAFVAYVLCVQRWVALPLALAQLVVTGVIRRARPRAADAVVTLAAWSAVTALGSSAMLAQVVARVDPRSLAVTAIGLAIVVGALAAHGGGGTGRRPWLRGGVAVACLAVLALESFRADDLFDLVSTYHWGCYLGPAADVRQGGWLLWDVSAHYGFLSILSVAAFPTTSVWDAFFVLDALLCFGTAALVFALLRRRMHALVALGVTLAAVLWLPGLHPALPVMGGGVHVTPAAGPMRFFWCQALAALVAARPRRGGALVAGSLLWLVGCLWAGESAFYCSLTWLPAYALIVWPRGRRARLAWVALPIVLAVVAVAGIEVWYRHWLGHPPDWYAFIESDVDQAVSGKAAIPIAPWLAVGTLVLVLWTVAAAGVAALRDVDRREALPALVAAYGLLWSTSSYFINRSSDVIVTDLLPIMCIAGAVVLAETGPESAPGLRPALAALFAGIVLLALHTPQDWRPRGERSRWALTVDDRRLVMDDDQMRLLHFASIPPGSPMVFYDVFMPPAWPLTAGPRVSEPSWMPVMPFVKTSYVAEPRRELYMARYAARTHASGWLIESDEEWRRPHEGDGGWFFRALARTHRRGRRVDLGRWRATWYQYVGTDRTAAAPPP